MAVHHRAGVDPALCQSLAAAEAATFARAHPRAQAGAAGLAGGAWLGGVPMHWMQDWPLPSLPIITRAKGALIEDSDGHRLDDFCLGDTGSMFGHAPAPLVKAIRAQAGRGLTYMLPSALAEEAGALLVQRFGPMKWQIATTATDANRFAIRVARAVTGRAKILVFNGAYHGTVDETMVALSQGRTVNRPGLVGQMRDLSEGAVAVEFNDLAALEASLAQGDIAAVLTEPVMTNCCMVLPEPGFHAGLRALTSRYGALLLLDETHTISTGLGGYGAVHGLAPDMLIVGKCVAGGMPTAVWGMTPQIEARYGAYRAAQPSGHSGMGTTLSGNPMQIACLAATLREVMTEKAYRRMSAGAARLEAGLSQAIARHGAPWHVVRVGARVEFICAPGPLKNGTEAGAAHFAALEALLHLGLLNRGSLIAPFHNMMLISPATQNRQIDRLVENFDALLAALFA